MKKRLGIIFLLMIVLLNTVVYATTLNLDVKSNKENLEVNEEVVITVDWKEGMQAADFIFKYDNRKFEFISIDLEDKFYKVDNSQVKIAWFSLDDTDKISINLTFKALKPGKAEFSTQIDGGFATGELVLPDNYNTGSTNVKINGFTIETLIYIVIPVVIIILVFIKKFTRKK